MYITIEEQTSIALGFEKSFAHLIRHVNHHTISSDCALAAAKRLVHEIKTINRPHYFEEDISQVMTELAQAIADYIDMHLGIPSPANDIGEDNRIFAVA